VDRGERVIISRHGEPVYELVAYRKKSGVDFEAGKLYLESLVIKDPFPYVSDDFDNPLPEDFLLNPLP
jgi:antitoxin (DNA-binding transcriptional repressor) of toxin-antitoxin stability system